MESHELHGALLVNKPKDYLSFDIIRLLRNPLQKKFKIGHSGTLDPFATGLLMIFFGKATKLAHYFLKASKKYEGTIRFGEATPSGDHTLSPHLFSNQIPTSLKEIQLAAHQMTLQPYQQVPPMFSAKKHHGQPLYKLARKGLVIPRKEQTQKILSFHIHYYTAPEATFHTHCSSGTYIRILAQDLAQNLGTIAHLTQLHRTQCGSFHIQKANTIIEIQQAIHNQQPYSQLQGWIPFHQLLPFKRLDINEKQYQALCYGQQNILSSLAIEENDDAKEDNSEDLSHYYTLFFQEQMVGIIKNTGSLKKIERVFQLPI